MINMNFCIKNTVKLLFKNGIRKKHIHTQTAARAACVELLLSNPVIDIP